MLSVLALALLSGVASPSLGLTKNPDSRGNVVGGARHPTDEGQIELIELYGALLRRQISQ